jgi:hypothetical protein
MGCILGFPDLGVFFQDSLDLGLKWWDSYSLDSLSPWIQIPALRIWGLESQDSQSWDLRSGILSLRIRELGYFQSQDFQFQHSSTWIH